MAIADDPASIDLLVVVNADVPSELQAVGLAYWDLRGVDTDSGDPVWTHRTSDTGFKAWSGTAHYAAAAAATATAMGYRCGTCREPLTLTSRQALTDAVRGTPVDCRSCNPLADERAAKILDPKSLDERAQRAAKADVDQQTADELLGLDAARKQAIAAKYKVGEDSGEYLIDHASLLAKVGALSVLHAVGDQGGLIYPVDNSDDTIGPNYSFSHELFQTAWYSDLIQIHPTSPVNAFVWKDGATLGDRIYANRVRFFTPGVGTLEKRLEDFARDLRLRIALPTIWSTERAELAALAERIIAEESGRYFVHMVREHNLPDLTETHEEALRTTTTRGASRFAIGHLYRMAWSSARDASSAYQRNSGMSKEKAITYGLKQLERWVQRATDDTTLLNDPFSEDKKNLPLSAVTGVVFRTILGLDPMSAGPVEIAGALAGSPDAELLRQCDEGIPDRNELIEWIRTSTSQWDGASFRRTLAQLEDWEPDLCAPHCAHERVGRVAKESGRVYDRMVARVGDTDAAILTAEATGVANALRDGVRTGDALLAEMVRLLDTSSDESPW
ncbi:MAG: hypothetical protein JWP19_2009 [Rhodoglobus sp.]|nr:hypothetical protein [Rhodoglobus sp.]